MPRLLANVIFPGCPKRGRGPFSSDDLEEDIRCIYENNVPLFWITENVELADEG